MNILFLLTICFMMLTSNGGDSQITYNRTGTPITVSPGSEQLKRLYNSNGNNLMWYCEDCDSKRRAMIQVLARAADFGLPQVAKASAIKSNESFTSDAEKIQSDEKLSELAVSFCMDLYAGKDMDRWTSYDGVSAQYKSKELDRVIKGLSATKDSSSLVSFITELEPKTAEYAALKQALTSDTLGEYRRHLLETSLNYYRWIHHFQLDSFIVINIPSATLKYYKGDEPALEMLAVVGKASNRTPRMADYCKEVTMYPYWNVPRSILVKELMAKLKKNPAYLEEQEMEIVNTKGQVVSASEIDWKNVSESNFPYRVRGKPGCSNALGVLKFSLSNPFDVYLHDTNFKGAFANKKRFLSHGCIRIEKPVDLANALLNGAVDEAYLNACYMDQEPQVIPLANPVPVFVVYMCAESDGMGSVKYNNDVYGLMK